MCAAFVQYCSCTTHKKFKWPEDAENDFDLTLFAFTLCGRLPTFGLCCLADGICAPGLPHAPGLSFPVGTKHAFSFKNLTKRRNLRGRSFHVQKVMERAMDALSDAVKQTVVSTESGGRGGG